MIITSILKVDSRSNAKYKCTIDWIDAMPKCQGIGSGPMMVNLKKEASFKHPSIFQIHLNVLKCMYKQATHNEFTHKI